MAKLKVSFGHPLHLFLSPVVLTCLATGLDGLRFSMGKVLSTVLVSIWLTQVLARLDSLKTVDDYMNICLLGKNHKSVPGPEVDGFKYCTPWAQRSCCTKETDEGLATNPKWLNFDWDHCLPLSPNCRQFFIMDLCFYECSPNVGPWLVKDFKKFRKERFVHVPLCQNECTRWWEACQNDFTCLKNWAVGFNWTSGINTCPQDSECKPFHMMYTGASDFCENLMGNSFKVVPDTEDCFHLWFDPKYPNPNEQVARKKAHMLLDLPYTESVELNGFERIDLHRNFIVLILLLSLFL